MLGYFRCDEFDQRKLEHVTGMNEAFAGYMRLKEVLELYPVSKSTWWKGIKEGRYPRPHRISLRLVAWRRADVIDLIEKAKLQ